MTTPRPLTPPPTPLTGSLDDFERSEVIGEGGTAVVYRARHRATGQAVALKVLRTAGLDPSWAHRFAREIRAVSGLRHPNIARVLGHGESNDTLFIAFELIDGGTVLDLKERMGGTLPVPVAVEILAQLLAALEYAHAAGTIHRDLKPGNVMLTSAGVVKLVDFGIARAHDDVPLTQTGAIVGTPAFMSPEQLEGDAADERSDLFSTGLVLYDMIVGESPFMAESTAATIMKLMSEEVPLLVERAGGVPWELERLHSRLVERERERRPFGADAVRDALAPLTRAGRDRWPRILADAVARPAETAALLRRSAALEALRRGQSLRARHGPHPSAVLAVHDAVRIDPSLHEATDLLPRYEDEAGVTVQRALDDDAVRGVRAALRLQPRQAVLWRRLADMRRLRGESFDELIALQRVLRLRSDDDAEQRLRLLRAGPEASAAPAPVAGVDIDDVSTTSVRMAARREGLSRAARVLGAPVAWLTAASLLLGLLVGAAAVMVGTTWWDDHDVVAPPPVVRRTSAQAMTLEGLTAAVGPGSSSLLTTSGPLTLGGTLVVELAPDFVPGAQEVFVIARAESIAGAFTDGGRAAARPAGAFEVEVRGSELVLVRYDPYGTVARRDGPRVALTPRGPAVVNLWGAPCAHEVASWPALRAQLPADARVVDVVRTRGRRLPWTQGPRRAEPAQVGAPGVPSRDADDARILDADGAQFFLPLGVSGCATFVIDAEGRPRLRTTATTPGALEGVRRAFEALATEVPFLEDTTASVGERVQRLRACVPVLGCAVETTVAWSTHAPLDEASVDGCLLQCDPGAAPRPVVLAAARAAIVQEDADRAVRLLEPWRTSGFADIHRALGDAYLKANRLEQARAHYRRYLELAPLAEDAEAVRRELAP